MAASVQHLAFQNAPGRSACARFAGAAAARPAAAACQLSAALANQHAGMVHPPGQGGWRTLWRGTQPTVIRLGLGAGLHFLILVTEACTLSLMGGPGCGQGVHEVL